MTVADDVLSKAKTYDVVSPIDPTSKRLHREVLARCHCDYVSSQLKRVNEVQRITTTNHTFGTFSVGLLGQTIIAPATVSVSQMQAFVDIVLVAAGYLPGDIVISGNQLQIAPMIFTYVGSKFEGPQPLITLDPTGLSGGSIDPVPQLVTRGIPARFWFEALKLFGVIAGDDPLFQAIPNGQYSVYQNDQNENYPSAGTIRALVREASIREQQDWESELLPLLGLESKSKLGLEIVEELNVIGQITPYGGSVAPSGWLLCDGASYATANYQELFAVIGYTYGGSGANFNVPDLRGRVAVGAGQGAGLTNRAHGTTGGAEETLVIPSHVHGVKIPTNDLGADTTTSDGKYIAGHTADAAGNTFANAQQTVPTPTALAEFNTEPQGGAGTPLMQPFIALNHLIRAK